MPENHRLSDTRHHRWLAPVLLAAMIGLPSLAMAQEGLVEDCEIDEYEYEAVQNRMSISGTATCSEARLELTVYDDESGDELASDFTYIADGEFQITLNAEPAETIYVEYTIE